jgi:hypothetical protein
MNRMMNYHCSNCCSVCLCTSSLMQTTTGLQATILPSIPLPVPRANPLVEREHPKFGSTGLSASDDHSANITFKERPPWAQMFTFSRQTLAPSITSASSLPGPGDSSDGPTFRTSQRRRSSIKTRAVWRRVQVRVWAVMVGCTFSGDGTNGDMFISRLTRTNWYQRDVSGY